MPRVLPSQVVEFVDAGMNRHPLADDRDYFNGSADFETSAGLRALLSLMEDVPRELLTMSSESYRTYVLGRSQIEQAVRNKDAGNLHGGELARWLRGRPDQALMLVRDALSECPDSAPAVGIAGLEFVDDEGLRGQLRVDMTEAFDAERNGDWKSATVLAGSVIEALLLWSLEKFTRDQINAAYPEATKGRLRDLDPKEWTLGPYIGAAHALALIDDDTRDQARLAQNFRNLIHPGRAARLGEQCNRGTSLGALAGMERVAEALRSRFAA